MNISQIINCLKKWSGFQDKKLWNWLELLIVPILLAIGGILLEGQADRRKVESDNRQAQQQYLKGYYDSIREIIKPPGTKNISQDKEDTNLIDRLSEEDIKTIEALTHLVFSEIETNQKRGVIKFLYDLELIKSNSKSIISLNQVDLTEVDLSNLNLERIDFQGVNLTKANLTNTKLKRGRFEDAIVTDAYFALADLGVSSISEADFGNQTNSIESKEKWTLVQEIQSKRSYRSKEDSTEEYCLNSNKINEENSPDKNDEKLDFTEQNFEKVNFNNLDLQNAIFKNSNLQGASLENSNLKNVNLKGAKLDNLTLDGSYLNGLIIDEKSKKQLDFKHQLIINIFEEQNNPENLIKTIQENLNKIERDLSFSNLSNLKLIGLNTFEEIQLKKIDLNNAILVCSDIENVDFSDSELYDIELSKSKLHNVILANSNLRSAKIVDSRIEKVNFNNADLMAADLSKSRINNSDFQNIHLNSALLKEAKINNVNLTDANLFYADLSEATIIDTNFEGADLTGTILCGANLLQAKNLDKANFSNVEYDDETTFPSYLNTEILKKVGVKNNNNCGKK